MTRLWLTAAARARRRTAFLILCLTVSVSSPPVSTAHAAPCAIGPLLAAWSGSGVVRRDASSPEEVVQCRFNVSRRKAQVKGAAQRTPTPLSMQLDCRGIDLTFSMTGRLDVSAQTGKIVGTFAAQRRGGLAIQRRGKAKATGLCRANGLALDLVYRNFNTGNIDTIRMTLSPQRKNGLAILTRTVPDHTPPRPVTLLSLTMTRQGR